MIATLHECCRLAAQGKRGAAQVARFLLDSERHLRDLAEDLCTRRYLPGAGRAFWIRDPKPRCIFALPFRDRVAQHLLMMNTLPGIERHLVSQTYACRTGKGTHLCLQRAAELCRTSAYVLRIDIRKFFPSIDHAILRGLLGRMIPPEWHWLQDVFLCAPGVVERADFHFPGDDLWTPGQRPHGLPIGSLTSQIWANVYLSPIDHLLASCLGLRKFVRYCDDILVFDDDAERLREALSRVRTRATELRLRLHPEKTRLHRTTDPVSFLGFVLRRKGEGVRVRLRYDNVVRMRQRMAGVKALYGVGALGTEEVRSHVMAWLAHAQHGQTRGLLGAELERLSFVRNEG